MNIENLIPDNRPYTKYAILTESEYLKLNKAISIALGYVLGDDTARYSNIIPNHCKVNVVHSGTIEAPVETYDVMAVMQINADIQENHSELLTGLELVDSYIPCDDTQIQMFAENLTTSSVDWMLNHTADQGTTLEVIHLESAPRSAESDQAVEQLVNEGITVITVE